MHLGKKKDKKQQPPKDVDYEQLGRMLETIVETGYMKRGKVYRMSFIKGVIGGFGGVIGATLVVAILAWSLSLFKDVPFVNRLTEGIRNTVQTARPQ